MGIQFTGLASGLDTQSIISDLMKVERMRVEAVEKDKVLMEWKKDAWDEVNSDLYSFYKEELFDFKSKGTYNKKSLKSSNESVIGLNTSSGAVRGSHEITVNSMAKGSFLTGTELVGVTASSTAEDLFGITDPATETITLSVDGGTTTHDVTIEAADTLDTILAKIDDLDLDLNVSFDSTFNRIFFSSTKTGTGVDVQLSGSETVLDAMGFASGNRDGSDGADASFTYNGTAFTSVSNEVSINGLSFNILADSGSSTVTVTQDVEAVYDSVKTFILKYNEIMLNLNEKIDAESARDYQPLTTEEKEAMSEDEIELWEGKIKTALLRRDETLSGITSTMRNTLTLSSGVDTTEFTYKTLSQLGIVTGGYEEKGLLHIEGDEDDSLYSLKDNKLREAIEDDPDAVEDLLTALGNAIYSEFNDRMKSSTLSSALTFYNDKYMDDQVSDFEDDIYDLEERLATVEDRYYAQFTAMEQAIQQSNSTGEWLAQQLGGM